jgi:hypothetical protein
MSKCAFSPTVLYVDEGARVKWVNDDPVPHTVTGKSMSLFGNTVFEDGDETTPFRFDDAGVYPYACIYHPGMVGAVVVGDAAGSADAMGVRSLTDVRTDAAPAATERGEDGILVGAAAIGAVVAALTLGLFLRRRFRALAAADSHG